MPLSCSLESQKDQCSRRKFMRNTLFVKIFLWFWLCIIIIIAAVAAIIMMHLGGLHGSEWRLLAERSLLLHGTTAVTIYEDKGKRSLLEQVRLWQKETHVTAFLFQGSKELAGRNVPQQLANLAIKVEKSGDPESISIGNYLYVARSIASQTGTQYVFMVESDRKGYFKQIATLPRYIVIKIICTLVFSALFCFALSCSFTSSIRKLRNATYRLAKGDLSSRVLPVIGNRNDELSDLAMDFDQMAERIELLVTSQKKLLADISHELRSPLSRLTVALDLCRLQAEEPLQKHLNRIEIETNRLNEMIGQLLDLARFESGIAEIESVRVDLSTLVSELVEDANFEAGSRGCRVTLINPEPCYVCGIPDHLRSAIENVIRNGLRFTRAETDVVVSVLRQSAASKVTILVRDHGPGVSEAALDKIFLPFYRVQDARDRQNGGTGLGLAITERIIRLHGGNVRAYNAAGDGGGFVVEITIPCCTQNPSDTAVSI